MQYTELEFDANTLEINSRDTDLFSITVSVDDHDLSKIADAIPVSEICNSNQKKRELLDEIGEQFATEYFSE